MSPSLSAVERGNPPPRRKSCLACVKAKRRCDIGIPVCVRCRQRKLVCTYASAPARPTSERLSAMSASTSPKSLDHVSDNSVQIALSACGPLENFVLEVDTSSTSSPDINLDPVLDFNNLPSSWTVDAESEPMSPMSLLLAAPSTVSPPLWRPTRKTVSRLLANHLQYAVDEMRCAPRMMILENRTPWCHPELYVDYMPQSMQDAHASCALYIAQNHVNASFITRSISMKALDLVLSPMPSQPLDILARIQALLLYMQMETTQGSNGGGCDDDNNFRSDRAVDELVAAAHALGPYICFDDRAITSDWSHASLPVVHAPTADPAINFWRCWVFQESARRTFIIALFYAQTYKFMTGWPLSQLKCDGKLMYDHAFTASAHLWLARDAVEFRRAWDEKAHFVVANLEFEQVVRDARGDDLEIFGKMMLSARLGSDVTRGWLETIGASF